MRCPLQTDPLRLRRTEPHRPPRPARETSEKVYPAPTKGLTIRRLFLDSLKIPATGSGLSRLLVPEMPLRKSNGPDTNGHCLRHGPQTA